MNMKKGTLFLMSVGLVFLGCVRTIQVDNRAVGTTPYPVVYEEEVRVNYEPRVVYRETPQPVLTQPVQVVPTQPTVIRRAKDVNISPLKASDTLMEGVNVMLLDVRTPDEIRSDGKIANSMLIPLDVLARNLHRLDKSKQIIVYCHTGNRSLEAMRFLRSRGFDALNMLGGLEAWKGSHLRVVWK